MSRALRRVYRQAQAGEAAGGFDVRLDGKPVRTPLRAPLIVPTQALAAAIAGEWEAQSKTIRPETMPLTRLASTTIDRVVPAPAAVLAQVLRYADNDLLCHRAPGPKALVAAQSAAWDPLLAWAAEAIDARLATSTDLGPVVQPPEARAAFARALAALDPYRLAAVGEAALATGSLVIALALARGRLDAAGAFLASHVDEDFQRASWGAEEDQDLRRATLRVALDGAERFLRLMDLS
ncbi:MAG: ATPase [Alphaproteobacteria bacterium]|nr:ATPase [Alphaproteobacteria bacterium]